MELVLLSEVYAVYRFAPDARVPFDVSAHEFASITRTTDEISIVCPEGAVSGFQSEEPGWKAFKVKGPLDLNLVGVLSKLSSTMAQNGIGIFTLSTYDTDYMLVKDDNVGKAMRAFKAAGHSVET